MCCSVVGKAKYWTSLSSVGFSVPQACDLWLSHGCNMLWMLKEEIGRADGRGCLSRWLRMRKRKGCLCGIHRDCPCGPEICTVLHRDKWDLSAGPTIHSLSLSLWATATLSIQLWSYKERRTSKFSKPRLKADCGIFKQWIRGDNLSNKSL